MTKGKILVVFWSVIILLDSAMIIDVLHSDLWADPIWRSVSYAPLFTMVSSLFISTLGLYYAITDKDR